MKKDSQCASAYYSINLKGNAAQIKEAVEILDDVIDDQSCFSEFLDELQQSARSKQVAKRYSWDKYVDNDEDEDEELDQFPKCNKKRYSWDKYVDDDDDEDEELEDDVEANPLRVLEETFDIVDTHACVWIEDILQLANDLAYFIPELSISISGSIEDSSEDIDDMMDFRIEYFDNKLTVKNTCWYICIYMDDFEDYYEFARKLCDQQGNPRYTEDDYQGFLECADKWYVLDSGHGEFSVDVPFGKANRVRIKKPKRFY